MVKVTVVIQLVEMCMTIADVFAEYEDLDIILPRAFYSSCSFNGKGTSLYYYINSVDSHGYDAGLKLDFFDKVRFTNFKKPHPVEKYEPYFDKFTNPCSCSYSEFEQKFILCSSTIAETIDLMAQHWYISTEKFINTILFAGDLLWDAENDAWLGYSLWEGGDFKGTLPLPKRR
ncbi:hypothetical protein NSMS1_55320 [Nostoc sp. MS1]|nr:hypothetical protein NSMS1_55320 [Nostoc sp. MS1]